jgi:hypothetical protein
MQQQKQQGSNGKQQGNKAKQRSKNNNKNNNVKRKNNKNLQLKLKSTMNMIHNLFMQICRVCRKEPLGCSSSNQTLTFHGN